MNRSRTPQLRVGYRLLAAVFVSLLLLASPARRADGEKNRPDPALRTPAAGLAPQMTREAVAGDDDGDAPRSPQGDGEPQDVPDDVVSPAEDTSRPADPSRTARSPFRTSPDPRQLEEQLRAYRARVPKTVVELQPLRRELSAEVRGPRGEPGTATLINLSPAVNVWYLLRLRWAGDDVERTYHLENADPAGQDLVLDLRYPHGLVVTRDDASAPCDLWSAQSPLDLETARASRGVYVSLCRGALTLRNPVEGHRTAKERVTDFLRDHVWLGEEITVFVRERFFHDAYLSTSAGEPTAGPLTVAEADAPAPALVRCHPSHRCLLATEIGIAAEGARQDSLAAGLWYPAAAAPGAFVSTLAPALVAPRILAGHRGAVDELDDVEAQALAYLVAFDLDRFDVRFALGTDHPRVEWSDRAPEAVRDPALPGPDGIDTIAPLVSTGMIHPALGESVAAAFTAGFKRSHGAFKWSELSRRSSGSHYGFVENGVVMSKLRPGLATLVVYADGSLAMKTWSEDDDARLGEVRFARQNGVPILERDAASGKGVPGKLVKRWGAGNWSGSQDEKLRSLRAGLCLQENDGKRFLVYGYFSSATPSAMARVFQAYDCRYAMHLDMNALEHTYLALYRLADAGLEVEHLVEGMEVLDKTYRGKVVPRFLGYADNRDFFYLVRKERGLEDAG